MGHITWSYLDLHGFMEAILHTTAKAERYIVHHQPALCTIAWSFTMHVIKLIIISLSFFYFQVGILTIFVQEVSTDDRCIG